MLQNIVVTLGKPLPPQSNVLGQMSKVTYSLTAGDAARFFALMNISGNFTMLSYGTTFPSLTLVLPLI